MTTNLPAAREGHDRFAEVRVGARDLELWRGERCLFEQFSFELEKPVLHVRGDNGSGKTTLLKLLCGLIAPEHGRVTWTFDGQSHSATDARGQLAYCGHLEGLNPGLSARENLIWGAGLYRQLNPLEIDGLAEQFGLSHLLPIAASGLSAGQRRRIALMRSVLSATPVWLWDEPYANLDTEGVAWVNSLINRHVDEGGCLIVSAHQTPAVPAAVLQTLELRS